MKFNKYLNESFEAYLKSIRRDRQSPIPIFLNPTRKEMGEIASGRARYIIDINTKKLYVWDAMEALHHTVALQLKLDTTDTIPGWDYNETVVKNGKLNELISYYSPGKEKEPDLNWAEPYFNHIIIRRLK